MSSFGSLFVFLFFMSLLLVSFISSISMEIELGFTFLNSFTNQTSTYKVSIDNIKINIEKVLANITNLSDLSIKVNEFQKIDVILEYTNINGLKMVKFLPFNQSYDGWKVKNVYTNGKIGEYLNIIRNSSGQWDKGETIEIEIKLSDGIDVTKPLILNFILPDGTKDYFIKI